MPSGFWAWVEETRTKRPPSCAMRVVEGAGGVLDGADEEVVEPLVVVEGRRGERLAALPAADEVDEAVDGAEALGERVRPLRGTVGAEEVGGFCVPALRGDAELGGEVVELLLVDVGCGDARAGVGKCAADGRPKAAGSPGDSDDASLERAHSFDATGVWRRTGRSR